MSGRTPFLGSAVTRAVSVWGLLVLLGTAYVVWRVILFVATGVHWHDVGEVFVLGLITLLRVLVLIAIASVIWVPAGCQTTMVDRIPPENDTLGKKPADPEVARRGPSTSRFSRRSWASRKYSSAIFRSPERTTLSYMKTHILP